MTGEFDLTDPSEPDLSELSKRAVILGKSGSTTDEAVRVNEAILDVDPENVDALLRLLRCRVHRSERTEAGILADRLSALPLEESDLAYLHRFRSEAHERAEEARAREEHERMRQEELADAQRARAALLASAKDVTSTREAQALGLAYRGADTELTIALLERGLEVAATSAETVSILAVLAPTYRDAGRLDEALAAYERAIEIEPSYELNRVVYTSMTATLRRMERLDEARRHGEEVLRHFPDDPFALNALGAVFRGLAARDEDVICAQKAEECFVRAAELEQGGRDSLRHLRTLLASLDGLFQVLAEIGDGAGLDAVTAQRERIERHLVRLSDSTTT